MRILTLHYPTGHPYWQAEEYKIEMPDGSIFDKTKADATPSWQGGGCHRIEIKKDGIYYQKCGASSGTGKTNWGDPFKIIDKSEYDQIDFAGKPLTMSDTLREDLSINSIN